MVEGSDYGLTENVFFSSENGFSMHFCPQSNDRITCPVSLDLLMKIRIAAFSVNEKSGRVGHSGPKRIMVAKFHQVGSGASHRAISLYIGEGQERTGPRPSAQVGGKLWFTPFEACVS